MKAHARRNVPPVMLQDKRQNGICVGGVCIECPVDAFHGVRAGARQRQDVPFCLLQRLSLIHISQGGTAEDIAQYLAQGNGGVVNSSRSVLLAYKKQPGTAYAEAAYNECVHMKEAIADACSKL